MVEMVEETAATAVRKRKLDPAPRSRADCETLPSHRSICLPNEQRICLHENVTRPVASTIFDTIDFELVKGHIESAAQRRGTTCCDDEGALRTHATFFMMAICARAICDARSDICSIICELTELIAFLNLPPHRRCWGERRMRQRWRRRR